MHLRSLAQLSVSEHHLLQGSSPGETFGSLDALGREDARVEGPVGSNYLLRAAAWEAYGNTALSSLYSNLQEQHHRHEVNTPDLHQSACRRAIKMANIGDRQAVFQIFERLRSGAPVSPEWKTWATTFGDILLAICLDRGEYKNAEVLLSSLQGMASTPQAALASKVEQAVFLSDQGRHQEAYARLQEGMAESHTIVVAPSVEVEALLRTAEVFMNCQQPLSALPYILKALTLSDQYYLSETMTGTLLLLAEVLLHFDLGEQSRALVEDLLPHVSAQGVAKQRGRLHLVLAKYHLASTPPALAAALRELGLCADLFAVSGSQSLLAETFYLQARINHDLGNIEERDRAAKAFRERTQQISRGANAGASPDVRYFHLDGRQETFVGR